MTNPENTYAETAEKVARLVDQGTNYTLAWYEADPSGDVRRAEQKQEREIQDGVRTIGAQATHQVEIASQLKRIENILDPIEREKAGTYYRATQIAKKEIKNRNC